ncbi:MAG TPA: hypothetical protein VFC65_09115 [Prolixibacteraceae bacterium]|nr:hypothetical protein [Prolixibacteraceae bacterium]
MKNRGFIKYILIFLLFAGMGCEEITLDQTFTIGKESTFRMNQLYISADGQYTLKISEIGDSRCPEGLLCIWSGEISVNGEWTENKNKTNIELHSVLKDLQTEPTGFSFQIVDAKPYPKIGTETKPEDLVISLLIQKK